MILNHSLVINSVIQEFDDYLKTNMASDLKKSHVEFDNERCVIQRWVTGVLVEMESWELSRRMQTMKVLKSEKLTSVNKWAIAIVPMEEFSVINCMTVKQVCLGSSYYTTKCMWGQCTHFACNNLQGASLFLS